MDRYTASKFMNTRTQLSHPTPETSYYNAKNDYRFPTQETNSTPCTGTTELSIRDTYRHLMVFNNQEFKKCEEDLIQFYQMQIPIGFALLMGNDRHPHQDVHEWLPVDKDLGLMRDVLERNGWYINTPDISTSHLTSGEWDRCFVQLRALNLQQYSCFLFYYSGHGNAKGVLLSDGSCKSYVDIVETITSIISLVGKPKIFIFDSCRLPKQQSFKSYFFKDIRMHHNQAVTRNYPPPDSIICYSANEGMESFSHDDYGSFYTQKLTQMLEQFMDQLTFSEIVTLTHGWVKQLAQQYEKEQQPVLYCTLNNLLVLSGELISLWFIDLHQQPFAFFDLFSTK